MLAISKHWIRCTAAWQSEFSVEINLIWSSCKQFSFGFWFSEARFICNNAACFECTRRKTTLSHKPSAQIQTHAPNITWCPYCRFGTQGTTSSCSHVSFNSRIERKAVQFRANRNAIAHTQCIRILYERQQINSSLQCRSHSFCSARTMRSGCRS